MSSDARVTPKAERYKHLRELGRGAMGVVDLVYDEVRAVTVARKRMHQLTSETRFQIKQEFRQAQEIRHPNLVRLYDLFADDDDAFFTMEPVFGIDVSSEVQVAVERVGSSSAEAVAIVVDRLRQLVDAVAALHAAGIVHRDIKPSNVLVEDNGRLVLLDFGFSSALDGDFMESEDRALIGTIPYMAPECLWGAPANARSDWYSVGAIAAELCLGRPLFAGSLQDMLRNKDRPIETLRGALRGLPTSIDEIVCAWLRRGPANRPDDLSAIRAALGGPDPPRRAVPRSSGIASTFIGRSEELAELERSIPLEACAQLVRLHGPSGIGKTSLARELTLRLSRRPGWVVFRGRCHPREHLALKALDSVMDEVSRYLKRAGPRVCKRVAALHGMDALTRMFPVLGRVPELASHEAVRERTDPQARWLDGLRAFRALWMELTAIDRIAVWIDDLQWADKDGLRLLHELIAVEPRPKVTWIASHRSTGPTKDDPAALLSQNAPDGSFDLSVSGLPIEEAAELSIRLGVSREVAGDVAREAAGSPFLVSELARFAASSGRLGTVDSILEDRLGALDREERTLAEQLALADEPLPIEALRGLWDADAVAAVLGRLENAALVRSSQAGDRGEVTELYHDRIRETVASRMSDEARRAVHLRLARALEQVQGSSPAAIAFHYRKAGESERGLALTLQAAEECANLLAFDQAAELYEEALALCRDQKPSDLLERTADALAQAGRCEDAARRFLDAGEQAEDPARKRSLRLQAGVHYLYVGRTSEARAVLEGALESQGLSWPKFPLVVSAVERARLILAGTRVRARSVKPEETERFDVLRDVARGHIHLDQTLTDAFALRALREALRLGDPSRMVWALGVEAASEALIGGPYLQRRARALLAQVEALAGRTGTPSDRAYATHIRGVIAFFQGDYAGAEAALLEAQRMFRDHESRTGFVHEINLNIPFLIATFEQRGNIGAMTLLLSELGASARRTGNLRSSFLFRAGSAGLVALARDKPIEAIGEGDAALADWPRADFGASHEYHLVITVSARIYAGLVAEAWEQVERTWPSLERAHFLRMEALGMQLRHLRARAALAYAASVGNPRSAELRKIASAEAAAVGRSQLHPAYAIRAAIEYGLAASSGNRALAQQHCESALVGFDRVGMSLAREATRLRLATICLDRERGQQLTKQARSAFAAAGVKNADAMTRLLMPGEPPLPLPA